MSVKQEGLSVEEEPPVFQPVPGGGGSCMVRFNWSSLNMSTLGAWLGLGMGCLYGEWRKARLGGGMPGGSCIERGWSHGQAGGVPK